MQTNAYQSRSVKSKAKLKLVQEKDAKAKEIRLGGTAPSESLKPGQYLSEVETAWVKSFGRGKCAVLQHRLLDGKHDGVGLRQWEPICDETCVVPPEGHYAKQCEIALGRPLRENDPVGDPAQIFSGRSYVVFVGYRKSERAEGGGKISDDLALVKKDDKDRLRVHEIVSLHEILES